MADYDPLSFSIGREEWRMDPKFHDFASFLGLVERDSKGVVMKADPKVREMMKQIYTWASYKSNSNDHEVIKSQVYKLQRKLGINWEGKILIDRLYSHTVFDTNFQRHLERMSKIEPKITEEKSKYDSPQKSEVAESKSVEVPKMEFAKTKETVSIKESPRGELKSEPI